MRDASLGNMAAYPFHGIFSPFPFVCFSLTLATDIAFWMSSNVMWQNFSSWLLFAGLIVGALALLAGLVDLLRSRTRPLRPSGPVILLYLLVLALALLNSFVHAGDGWTAVVPYGLVLSAATVFLTIACVALSARKYARLAWRV